MKGISSGFFYIDDAGTLNGTTFTITVTDGNPRFFYMVRDIYLSNCAVLSGWTLIYNIPTGDDVLFALNPVVWLLRFSNNVEQCPFFRCIQEQRQPSGTSTGHIRLYPSRWTTSYSKQCK